jgi:hypothetical protein
LPGVLTLAVNTLWSILTLKLHIPVYLAQRPLRRGGGAALNSTSISAVKLL